MRLFELLARRHQQPQSPDLPRKPLHCVDSQKIAARFEETMRRSAHRPQCDHQIAESSIQPR